MTITDSSAYEAIRSHHRLLTEQLGARAAAVSEAASAGQRHEAAVASLVAYLAGEVLPHAAAEEETIYPAAAAHADLSGLVNEMTAEHRTLSAAAEALAGLADASAAATQASQIAQLFAAHAARENEVLLPALLAEDVDLATLMTQMHRRAEQSPKAGLGRDTGSRDGQAALLKLLLEAATALARAGDADLACRLAAAAWAAVREDRPDLATKVTAALHGLTRRAGNPPGREGETAASTGGPAAGTTVTAGGPDLDVRDLPPAQRHEAIFAAYRDLAAGAGFVLVNDHDPKPLRYQFEAEHAGDFTWDSLEAGPEVWRVRIGRPPVTAPAHDGQAAPGGDGAEPDLDVRELAHWQRHDVIFTAYRSLSPGGGFVLVNDHDPLPLRYQFEAQYQGAFTWDYLESGPKAWRVRIGRTRA